jgi:hypothetical protein
MTPMRNLKPTAFMRKILPTTSSGLAVSGATAFASAARLAGMAALRSRIAGRMSRQSCVEEKAI